MEHLSEPWFWLAAFALEAIHNAWKAYRGKLGHELAFVLWGEFLAAVSAWLAVNGFIQIVFKHHTNEWNMWATLIVGLSCFCCGLLFVEKIRMVATVLLSGWLMSYVAGIDNGVNAPNGVLASAAVMTLCVAAVALVRRRDLETPDLFPDR